MVTHITEMLDNSILCCLEDMLTIESRDAYNKTLQKYFCMYLQLKLIICTAPQSCRLV